MNTKKIKTAIIVLLVLANTFFIYNLYTLNIKTSRIPHQMIDDAVTVLNRSGLNISKDIIPDIRPQNFIYEGVYSHSPETFEEIVKYLSESEISTINPMPNGMSYNAGEYKFDFSGTEDSENYFLVSISFDSSEQGYTSVYGDGYAYEDLETKVGDLILKGLKDYKKMDIAKAENVIANFLKKYQPGIVDFETIGFEKNAENEYLVIRQKLDGLAFNSHIVFVEISDRKVYRFIGKWYFGAFAERYKMPLLDSVNILFKCLERDGNVIEDSEKLENIELYYGIVWHEMDKFYLIPSWRLKFDSGRDLSYIAVIGK